MIVNNHLCSLDSNVETGRLLVKTSRKDGRASLAADFLGRSVSEALRDNAKESSVSKGGVVHKRI